MLGGGRILGLAFLLFCGGCALIANSWRSLQQREGMYDAQSTSVMLATGWAALLLGVALAGGGGWLLFTAALRFIE
jgi:hypothetical protein